MATASTLKPEQDAQIRADVDRSLRHPVMFFFTSGAAWLGLSLFLGIIASIQTHNPEFLSFIPGFHFGRTHAAHMDAFIYGWAAQAAFGVMIWLMSRLSRQPSRCAGMILAAGHVWNAAVGFGIFYILAFGGTGQPWMQMPTNVYPVLLLCYAVIGIGSFVNFRTRRGGHVYISQWYILAALFWFPWILGGTHLFVNVFEGHGLAAAGVNGPSSIQLQPRNFRVLDPRGGGTVVRIRKILWCSICFIPSAPWCSINDLICSSCSSSGCEHPDDSEESHEDCHAESVTNFLSSRYRRITSHRSDRYSSLSASWYAVHKLHFSSLWI